MSPWRFTLLGYHLAFARPMLLLGFLALAALAFLVLRRTFSRRERVGRLVPTRLVSALAPGANPLPLALKSSSAILALACFTFALAQPQCGQRTELAKRKGLDIVVALDVSRSMLARDIHPSRLDRARLELDALLENLRGDRVAVVTFAGDAFLQCPLTHDYAAAKTFLRAADPQSMPQGGTNIGAALALAKQTFENAERGAKERIVVLLTDGEDLEGNIDEGLAGLREIGARIYAIGIGSETGEPIPLVDRDGNVTGYQTDDDGKTVLSRLDSVNLKRIAEASGGAYFNDPRGVAMSGVIDAIAKLEKSEFESRLTVKYSEAFRGFVFAGILFLLAAGFLPSTWRRGANA